MTTRERAGRLIYVKLEQRMSSPEAQTEALLNEWMVLARHNRRVHDEGASYFRNWADARMIVDRIGEHQIAAQCSVRGDPSGAHCHREYFSDCVGPYRAFGDRYHDFVQAARAGRQCDKPCRLCIKV